MTDKFTKLYIALKFRLHGAKYFKALKALEFGMSIHTGFRKDGETPEFQHQIEIALYILTLKDIDDLETVMICALLHDTLEDYSNQVSQAVIKKMFGDEVLHILNMLNKKLWNDYSVYFKQLGECPIGSIVKLSDRINNFQSMSRGNFSVDKQEKYAAEVMEHFLPMAKISRKLFPTQMDAYYNIEIMLKNQYELISLFVKESRS